MLASGTLKDRITFSRTETTQNDIGEQTTSWTEVVTCWANVKYQKGWRDMANGEVWLPNTIIVTIRWRSNVDDRMRIRWDGQEYYISAFNRSRDAGSITITATKIQAEDGKEE